jgi:glycosyltransferase involved in cell wall biosynthesis
VSPFFSVVVPVYNRADDLRHALASVLAQTEQDFEIVVADDGSKDDPKAVIDRIADPRIRYVRQENRGGGAARNLGIDNARGTFIAFLDSDDIFLPNHLTTMRRLLEGTANIVGYARMIVDRGDGKEILKPPRAIRANEDMATYLLCDRGFVPTITTVVPAALARAVRYHENLREAEDTDFAVRLSLAGCRFVMAETPGAVWKDHYDPNRQSAGRSTARMEQWLNGLRPNISRKGYLGGMGWAVAKGVVTTNPLRALGLYLNAIRHGCYSPGLAAIVFLQIFLPNSLYRAVADGAIRWLRAGTQLPAKKPA